MLTWVLLGASFSCSQPSSISAWADTYYVSAMAALPPAEELDVKYLQQQGHVSGLDWHGCQHWHVDGFLTLDVYQPTVTPVADIRASSDPNVGQANVSNGYYGIAKAKTLYAPVGGGVATAVIRKSTNEALVVRAYADTTDGRTGKLCAMLETYTRRYNYTTRRYEWGFASSAVRGFGIVYDPGRQPTLGAALRVVTPRPNSAYGFTINRVATNDCRPVAIPTRRQLTSLIAHELAQVVASAQEARYRALEELHAHSFDSVMKFDGNMTLLLSKLGGLGRTTIQSMIEFAGSNMGLKDAASLWLASRYGDRLSASGLESLVRSIDREFLTIRLHTVPWVEGSARQVLSLIDEDRGVRGAGYVSSRIALKPKDYNTAMRVIRNAYEWDWMPTLGNTWDAIPLSFVVDWFVNVGDIYASLDRLVAARYYDVLGVLNTVKVVATTTRFPTVEYTYYDREISKNLQLSVESVKLGLPSAVNWVNGAALFVGMT